MENWNGWDLLEWLGPDSATSIFNCIDDPADLVRATAVSRSWRQFVIANGFSKRLCIKLCPEVSYFTSIKEITPPGTTTLDESSSTPEWRNHETDHKIYAYLSQHLFSTEGTRSCISYTIGASSTDNYLDESIDNTLELSENVNSMASYWSSGGQVDPTVPESLMYQLAHDVVFVHEIRIEPFSAFFHYGAPIYSSKFVQFKLGYTKQHVPLSFSERHQYLDLIADENYVWTYISPQFPMQQENVLQSFKLPRPVLCIGGVVKVELLGRVQKCYIDNLYYICICHVQVRGRKLSLHKSYPLLGVDVSRIADGGGAVLNYCPMA
ncbi:F-box family protein [Carex rostrata]